MLNLGAHFGDYENESGFTISLWRMRNHRGTNARRKCGNRSYFRAGAANGIPGAYRKEKGYINPLTARLCGAWNGMI